MNMRICINIDTECGNEHLCLCIYGSQIDSFKPVARFFINLSLTPQATFALLSSSDIKIILNVNNLKIVLCILSTSKKLKLFWVFCREDLPD